MRNRLVNTFVLIVGIAASASLASAQTPERLLELGTDAGLDIALSGPSQTTFIIPKSVRAGLFLSPKWSIEPSLALATASGDGGSATNWDFRVGALYHFSKKPNRLGGGAYVRPFLGIIGNTNDTRAGLGGGVGYKFKLYERLSARTEANLAHVFGDEGQTSLGLSIGLSYFTR